MPTSSDCTVICYTRPNDVEPIDAHIETLQHCEATGPIDTLVLCTWPAELPLSGADSESRATFERFRA